MVPAAVEAVDIFHQPKFSYERLVDLYGLMRAAPIAERVHGPGAAPDLVLLGSVEAPV